MTWWNKYLIEMVARIELANGIFQTVMIHEQNSGDHIAGIAIRKQAELRDSG